MDNPTDRLTHSFNARWGRSVMTVSIVVGAVVLAIPFLVLLAEGRETWMGFMGLLPVVFFGLTIPFAVFGYEVTDDAILVERPLRRTRIPLAGIQSVEVVEKLDWKTLRLFGSGGFLGFYGLFWNRQWGRFQALATDLNRCVLVSGQRKWLLSPDDPERFLASIREHQEKARDASRQGDER